MIAEIKRVAVVWLIIFLWVVSIVLNVNGYFVLYTKVLFYILPILYVVMIIPDMKYLAAKKKRIDGDWFSDYLIFIKNFYRYTFFFILFPVFFEVASNLYFINSDWFNRDLNACLKGDHAMKMETGVLFVTSYHIKNSVLTEFDIVTSATTASGSKRVNFYKRNNQLFCK